MKKKKLVLFFLMFLVAIVLCSCSFEEKDEQPKQIVKIDRQTAESFPVSLPYNEKEVTADVMTSQVLSSGGNYTLYFVIDIDCQNLTDEEFSDFWNRYCYVEVNEFPDGERIALHRLGTMYDDEAKWVNYVFITSPIGERKESYEGKTVEASFTLAKTNTPELVERINLDVTVKCQDSLPSPDDVIQDPLKSYISKRLKETLSEYEILFDSFEE